MQEIYNSLTSAKQPLLPREPGKVGLYVCGITPHDQLHVGHARMLTVFDVVVRHLRHAGYQVTYVRNITDIDDRIIRRAEDLHEPVAIFVERMIAAMREDSAPLGLLNPDIEPRVSQYVPQIIDLVSTLMEKGNAYLSTGGDVMFSVRSFSAYGRLSGREIDRSDRCFHSRAVVDSGKRDPEDFALWKRGRDDEPSWPSPWGYGRPGWHIECSAMALATLGPVFDIHGGGVDLKFPHHENEIAQSTCATGGEFAEIWMHNGSVRVSGIKMSKSAGTGLSLREALSAVPHPEVLRYYFLSKHYREPIDFDWARLTGAATALRRIYKEFVGLTETSSATPAKTEVTARFLSAMNGDFHTPQAIAVLQQAAGRIRAARRVGARETESRACELRALARVLGLGNASWTDLTE